MHGPFPFACLTLLRSRSARRILNDETDTPKVEINWGKFGTYELTIAADGESMDGSAKGQPENWRKAKRLRSLGQVAEAHVHDH